MGPRLHNPTKNGTRNVPKSFQNQSKEKQLENNTAPAPEAHFEATWDSKNIQKWHPETTPNHSKIIPRSTIHEFLENSTAPAPDAHFEGTWDSKKHPKMAPETIQHESQMKFKTKLEKKTEFLENSTAPAPEAHFEGSRVSKTIQK